MVALNFSAPSRREQAERKRRRAAIRRRIRREVLAELDIDELPEAGERTLVSGAQGTGKSRTAGEGIAAIRHRLVCWWLVPTHKKTEEQRAEYDRIAAPESMPSMVVRGRSAADPRDPDEAMCPRHEVVDRAARMGVHVQKEICGSCPLSTTCGFQAQRAQLDGQASGLFIMSHEYLWLPCPAPDPDIVIVDESVIDRAAEIVSFDPTRITDPQKWVVYRNVAVSAELAHIAGVVRRTITEHPGRELEFLREQGITGDDLRRCVRHLAASEEARPSVNGAMSDRDIAAALDAVGQHEIRKVHRLFRQIQREIDQPRRQLNSVWFDPSARVKVDGKVEHLQRVLVGFVRDPAIAEYVPVLALDGTGAIELNRRVFGDWMEGFAFKTPRDAYVIQAQGKSFSRQGLTGADRHGNPVRRNSVAEAARLRGHILELLRLLPGGGLLVTYKQVEDLIRPELPGHVSVAHFGNLRGLNEFEHCKTVVVLGREQPSAQAIESLTRPFTATDPEPFLPVGEYAPQSRGRRQCQDGSNVGVVPVHPDPRCQAMLEQVREAEIAQAVDRVRPVFNHRTVLLLTDQVLDVTVDQTVPWRELRPNALLRAFARFGVLPLVPSDMAAAFPDLWGDRRAAAKVLERSGFRDDISQIDSLFGVCRLLIPRPTLGTYRRLGQRGKPRRVVLYAGLENPRAALEALVGPLADFQLDVIETPPAAASSPEPPHPAAEPPPPPWAADRPLPPLAAALAAEAHLLGTSDPTVRLPDMFGAERVRMLLGASSKMPNGRRLSSSWYTLAFMTDEPEPALSVG